MFFNLTFREYLKLLLPIMTITLGILIKPRGVTVAGGVLTKNQLAEYNGVVKDKLYLALVGSVFDVTEGKQHYGEDGSYHYFVGKDGSRALITGNFKDESDNKDHVLDLTCTDLFALLEWRDVFTKKYIPAGVVEGRYYDRYGKETEYTKQLHVKMDECKVEKEMAEKQDMKFPPCNMEWSTDDGTRVWCTKSSGGVSRDWVGVPRQLFTPGDEKPRCVCVNADTPAENSLALLKEYDGCSDTSPSCISSTN